MSTLELENIKHADASSNALELAADGSLTLGTVSSNIVTGGNIDANGTLHQFGNGASTYVQINNASSGDISSGYNIVSGSNTTTSLYGNADEEWTTLMSGGSIGFRVNQNVSGFNPMNIDTSGRVTMPYQPSFYARLHASFNSTTTGAEIVPASSLSSQWNIGGGFSGNRFTAPVAGRYMFIFSVEKSNNYVSVAVAMSIWKNGSEFPNARLYRSNQNTRKTLQYTMIMDMAVNDYAEPFIYSYQTGSAYDNRGQFAGYLIG